MTQHEHSHARHRAGVRPKTFLSDLPCSGIARRGSIGLAVTGLALGLVAPTASASAGSGGDSPAPQSAVSASSAGTYTVRAGDTVAEIAHSRGSSVSAIIATNGLGADALIYPGDELTIPDGSGGGGQSAAAGGDEEATVQAAATTSAGASTSAGATTSGNAILAEARQHVGTPYVWGGSAPGGFDCSGFTQHVFAQVGIDIPRSTSAQRSAGTPIPESEARPGDLVWWPGHVGIYTGDGNHIAARNPGTALHESPIHMDNPTFLRVG